MSNKTSSEPLRFDRYEVVLLKRPAFRPDIDDSEAERIQERHLAHLTAMVEAGHMRVAGPFDEQSDDSLRGLCLYQTGSLETARELASADPAVVAGRLDFELMYFYCPAGQI